MPNFGKGYDNIDDAAAAALTLIERQPRAEGAEYMALLVRDPNTGKIYRTDLQTQGKRGTSSWQGYPDGEIVGVVHNHPAPTRNDRYPATMFSGTDIGTATQLGGVPSYIAAMRDSGRGPRSDHRRLPKDTSPDRTSPIEGEQFLAQIPIDLIFQLMARDNPLLASILQNRQQQPNTNVAQAAPATRLPLPQSGARPKQITGATNGNSTAR